MRTRNPLAIRQHGPSRISLLAGCLVIGGALAACSIDNHGTLAAKVTAAEGAYVVDTYAVGASLRTRADDPGISVGFDRRSYVFDTASGNAPSPGWYYFSAPLPESPALVLHTENYGAEFRGRASDTGVSLGYRATTVMAEVPADESTYRLISYLPDAPEDTSLYVCHGEWPCQ